MIIEKNTAPEEDEFREYPYYIARIQQRFISATNGLGGLMQTIDS